MTRKKLLYITRPQAGGMAKHLQSLVKYFADYEEVMLAAPPEMLGSMGDILFRGVRFFPIFLDDRISPAKDVVAAEKLLRICRREGVDLVHVHGFKAAPPALAASLLSRTPAIMTVHNSLAYPGKSVLPEALFQGGMAFLDPLFSCYVAVSGYLRQELVEKWAIDENKVHVVYNGVDVNKGRDSKHSDTAKPALALNAIDSSFPACLPHPARIRIGTTGRLVHEKGIDCIIQAAGEIYRRGRHFPVFLIAGEGIERAKYEVLRDRLGLRDRVFFLGRVDNVPAFLNCLDIFVLASRSEGLSYSLLEAGLHGLPLVASAVGGIPEVVCHGKTGLLFEPEDHHSLAFSLSVLLEKKQERRRMGLNAAADIKKRFNEQKMLQETEKIYHRVFRSTRAPKRGQPA